MTQLSRLYDLYTEESIPVNKSQERPYNLNRTSFFTDRFWGRLPDGVAIKDASTDIYVTIQTAQRQG